MDEIERSAFDFFLALVVVSLLILALFGVQGASAEWRRHQANISPETSSVVVPERLATNQGALPRVSVD